VQGGEVAENPLEDLDVALHFLDDAAVPGVEEEGVEGVGFLPDRVGELAIPPVVGLQDLALDTSSVSSCDLASFRLIEPPDDAPGARSMFPPGDSGGALLSSRAFAFQRVMALSKPSLAMSANASPAAATAASNAPRSSGAGGVRT
jgi:hypothetical protein